MSSLKYVNKGLTFRNELHVLTTELRFGICLGLVTCNYASFTVITIVSTCGNL